MCAQSRSESSDNLSSWRAGRTASRAQQRAEPDWKKRASVSDPRKLGYRIKVFGLPILLLLLLGGLLYVLWSPGRTSLVAIVATDYQFPVPPNAWASEDAEAFEKQLERGFYVTVLDDDEIAPSMADANEGDHARAAANLAGVVSQNIKKNAGLIERVRGRPVVVYVSMHGVMGEAGEPCLLPPRAEYLNSQTWIRLGDFIDALQSKSNLGNRKILLLLDCNRLRDQWGIGLLYNGFAEGLQKWVDDRLDSDPSSMANLAILNSTGPGEVARVSSVAGRSVFAFSVQAALSGKADGYPEGRENGSVSTDELGSYVKDHVEAWVRTYRHGTQRPIFLADEGVRFNLANAAGTSEADDKRLADRPVSEDDIEELWKRAPDFDAQTTRLHDPIGFHDFRAQLLWLEQLNAAGKPYAARAAQLHKQLEDYPTGFSGPSWPELDSLCESRLSYFKSVLELYAAPQTEEAVATADELQTQLNVLSTPASPQVHWWTRHLISKGDHHRRRAEDLLFVGTDEARVAAGEQHTADTAYNQAKVIQESIQYARRVLDRAWAELPYLALWAASRGRFNRPDLLSDAIDNAHELAKALEDFPGPEENGFSEAADGIRRLAFTVDERREELRDSLDDETGDLKRLTPEAAGGDPLQLRRIAEVLRIPLVPGPDRRTLRKIYEETSQRLDEDFADTLLRDRAPAPQSGSPAEADESIDASYLNRLGHWNPHPALTLLQSLATPSAQRDVRMRLADEGKQFRDALQYVQSEKWRDEFNADGRAFEASEALRRRLHRPAQRVRRAAAWLIVDSNPGKRRSLTEPLLHVPKIDWHNLLLASADRALDDFWGPAPTVGATANDRPFFFDTAAREYLKLSEALYHIDGESTDVDRQAYAVLENERSQRDQTRRSRVEAAQHWIEMEPAEIRLADLTEGQQPIDHVTRNVQLDQGLPPGEATFYLRRVAGSEVGRRQSIDVTASKEEVPPLSTELLREDAESALEALAFYRGHVRPVNVPLSENYFELVSEPRPQPTATVQVHGGEGTANLMFVFDCSGSMSESFGGTSRLNVARDAIRSILGQLATHRDRYRVGLRIYGHRTGYLNRPPTRLAVRRRNDAVLKLRRDNMGLQAWRADVATVKRMIDVDRVLPLERFTKDLYDEVSELLVKLRPLGVTPLYYSILTAVEEDFQNVPAGEIKRIIVLTDGANLQQLDREDNWDGPVTTLRMVENALRADPSIQLDIVGITLNENVKDTLRRLAQPTGGDFHDARERQQLVQQLEQAVITSFELQPDGARTDGPKPIGQKITINNLPNSIGTQGDPFTVEVSGGGVDTSTDIALNGGEALELRVVDGGLQNLRYGEQTIRRVDTSSPDGGDSDFEVRFHDHRIGDDGDVLELEISLAHKDPKQFTPRPAEMWVEILRRRTRSDDPSELSGRQEVVYPFYDLAYKHNTRSPVITCRAPHWSSAPEARIKLWFKFEATTPIPARPLRMIDSDVELDELPGVYFTKRIQRASTGGTLVRIKERNTRGTPPDWVKVELVPPPARADSPQPSRVTHGYDLKNGIGTHHFYFDGINEAEAEQFSLRATTFEDIRDGAYRLTDRAEPHTIQILRANRVPLGRP